MIAFAGNNFGNPLFPRKYFELPDAVSLDNSREMLRSGYKIGRELGIESGLTPPYPLIVAQSKDRILPMLYQLTDFLLRDEPSVQFFVDTFTDEGHSTSTILANRDVAPLELISTLKKYEDLLLNDGVHSYAIATPSSDIEVQLDDHKLILIYAYSTETRANLRAFLNECGIAYDPELPLVIEQDHHHHTQYHHLTAINDLAVELRLSAEKRDDSDSWDL